MLLQGLDLLRIGSLRLWTDCERFRGSSNSTPAGIVRIETNLPQGCQGLTGAVCLCSISDAGSTGISVGARLRKGLQSSFRISAFFM